MIFYVFEHWFCKSFKNSQSYSPLPIFTHINFYKEYDWARKNEKKDMWTVTCTNQHHILSNELTQVIENSWC